MIESFNKKSCPFCNFLIFLLNQHQELLFTNEFAFHNQSTIIYKSINRIFKIILLNRMQINFED